MTQHTEVLQTTLYEEMLARIKETDLSVPYRKGLLLLFTHRIRHTQSTVAKKAASTPQKKYY